MLVIFMYEVLSLERRLVTHLTAGSGGCIAHMRASCGSLRGSVQDESLSTANLCRLKHVRYWRDEKEVILRGKIVTAPFRRSWFYSGCPLTLPTLSNREPRISFNSGVRKGGGLFRLIIQSRTLSLVPRAELEKKCCETHFPS